MLRRSTLAALLAVASCQEVGAQTMASEGWTFSGAMLMPQDATTRQRMPGMPIGDLDLSTVRIIATDDGTGLVHLRLEQHNGREILVKPSSLLMNEGCRKSATAPRASGRDTTVAASMGAASMGAASMGAASVGAASVGAGGAERCAP